MLQNLLALRQIAKRTISTASRRQFENKVPEKQKLFQEDNGIPVHLKGGVADALLYRATMILTVGGTAYAMYELAVASFPKKQDWLQFILPAVSWFNSIQLSVDQ
uniref:Cytochrome c oxidase subunit 7A2, mitochondrial n=1 Tax=Capra hircus TaxID=9925 RepID=A0A452DXW4_CAPHI